MLVLENGCCFKDVIIIPLFLRCFLASIFHTGRCNGLCVGQEKDKVLLRGGGIQEYSSQIGHFGLARAQTAGAGRCCLPFRSEVVLKILLYLSSKGGWETPPSRVVFSFLEERDKNTETNRRLNKLANFLPVYLCQIVHSCRPTTFLYGCSSKVFPLALSIHLWRLMSCDACTKSIS